MERIDDAPVTVSALRQLNFLAGGAGHVVWLGVLVGAVSVAAHRARALPRWLTAAGMVAAVMSALSLVSLAAAPAALFIPLGRFSALLLVATTSVLMAPGRMCPGAARPSVPASVTGGVGIVALAFGVMVGT